MKVETFRFTARKVETLTSARMKVNTFESGSVTG
jgi:hypothetical protein